ncbi:uncharacterized protein ARMOST_02162 [Armillaria ostoyae]|uniref:Uncharacterized protein n=1 Tax=Armillaria ostoyae TaxID=47428 RepID=A0A284QR02_ARMOS|nr:uncharacterized protein ARMOST_02162 [Armillaria ostoyae]
MMYFGQFPYPEDQEYDDFEGLHLLSLYLESDQFTIPPTPHQWPTKLRRSSPQNENVMIACQYIESQVYEAPGVQCRGFAASSPPAYSL